MAKTKKTEGNLTAYFENNWLVKITNSKGHLAPVGISQTGHPGFTVSYDKPPYRQISWGHKKAEKLAERLAKKGHKVVTLRC